MSIQNWLVFDIFLALFAFSSSSFSTFGLSFDCSSDGSHGSHFAGPLCRGIRCFVPWWWWWWSGVYWRWRGLIPERGVGVIHE